MQGDLWYRLVGDFGAENTGGDVDPDLASIQVALERLLNSRCHGDIFGRWTGPERDTVLNYGLPALDDLSPTTRQGRARLADRIARAIRAFEPRLQDVDIILDDEPDTARWVVRMRLLARVAGDVDGEGMALEASIDPATEKISLEAAQQDED